MLHERLHGIQFSDIFTPIGTSERISKALFSPTFSVLATFLRKTIEFDTQDNSSPLFMAIQTRVSEFTHPNNNA
jgi:hypothetical protein